VQNFIYILIAFVLILIDLVSKYFARIKLKNKLEFDLIKHVIKLTYLENHGAAFGILQNQIILFSLISIFVLIAIVYYFLNLKTKLEKIFVVLLFSGTVGNFIDRLCFGRVIDFIAFDFINFPVFNLADIFLCIGVTGLFFMLSFGE